MEHGGVSAEDGARKWRAVPRRPGRHRAPGADFAPPARAQFTAALKKETGATRVGMAGYCYGGTINLNSKLNLIVPLSLHTGV